MSTSFVSEPMAVHLVKLRGEGFIRTADGDDDFVFELYAVEGDKALILNERSLEWVSLDRVHVILSADLPDSDPGHLEIHLKE